MLIFSKTLSFKHTQKEEEESKENVLEKMFLQMTVEIFVLLQGKTSPYCIHLLSFLSAVLFLSTHHVVVVAAAAAVVVVNDRSSISSPVSQWKMIF